MAAATQAGEWQFHLSGDVLCLDFANTVSWRRSSSPIERLAAYGDLVSWARQTGLISDLDAARIRRAGAQHPRQSARLLETARNLREAIFRIFASVSERRQPAARDLGQLNLALRSAAANRRLVRKGNSYIWQSADHVPSIPRVLQDVAWSAAELLSSDELASVGQCHGRECRWLFIDRTRNRSRRWCDMTVCGNRAKAQRFYRRSRRHDRSGTTVAAQSGKRGPRD